MTIPLGLLEIDRIPGGGPSGAPSEHVTVTLLAVRHHDGGDNHLHDCRLAHRCEVAREADGRAAR
jgi:hypothetical protein